MKSLMTAVYAELLKLRRARIVIVVFVFFILLPAMLGLMMYLALHPGEGAGSMMSSKAALFKTADWSGMLDVAMQMFASVSLLGFGFVTSWVFGREFTDGMLKDILVLPVSRWHLVLAKFVIVLGWGILLTLVFLLALWLTGMVVNVPGQSFSLFEPFVYRLGASAVFTLLLSGATAFVVSISRSQLAGVGLVVAIIIFAQFSVLLGIGPYFPWTIPGLYGISLQTGIALYTSSYVILAVTAVLGFASTGFVWRFRDQH